MTVTCREMVRLLMEFLEDELTPEERAVIQEHIDSCPPCFVYVETYQVTVRLSRQMRCAAPPRLPADLEARLKAKVAAKGAADDGHAPA